MGVPGFFAWLKNKYKKDNFILKKQHCSSCKYKVDINMFYDSNNILKKTCNKHRIIKM